MRDTVPPDQLLLLALHMGISYGKGNCREDGKCSIILVPACAQVVRELGVIHLCVTTLTKFWVISPELLVPLVQEIDLERMKFSEN